MQNDWEGTKVSYTGNIDYMVSSSTIHSVDTMDSFLLIVEANKEWSDDDVYQVLCEAGCLLKKRLAAER